MVLLDKQVVVLLDDDFLRMDDLGLFDFAKKLVVDLGPLINQPQFGLVTVPHLAVKLSLQQEGNDKPINANEPINMALSEQEDNGNQNSEGSLNHHVHVFKHQEDEF